MTRFFDAPVPRVLAHRGFAVDAPENTLLAFARALALGTPYLETDVHATLDGVAIISHDADLGRVAGNGRRLSLLTLEQVRAVRLPEDQTVPTLQEALEAFPDAFFNIDVKADEAVRPTAEAIVRADAVDRVLVTSFSTKRRRAVTGLLPGVASSASSWGVGAALVASTLPRGPLRRLGLRLVTRGFDAVQVPERWWRLTIATEQRVADWAAAGIETHVWTVDDPDDVRRLVRLGVVGIVTDRTDLALETLAPPPAV
ncbi:glycerophosphodiester phosphodiesterase family protein [Frigoribacterium salinisoli]